MSCLDYENLVALSVTGDLAANQAARVQAHLEQCESCRELAEAMRSDRQWLQSAHREPADRAALHQVRVGVMRQLESEQGRGQRPFGGLAVAGWRWQWVAVPALAALLGGIAWWVRPGEPQKTTVATQASGENQRAIARARDQARPADPAAVNQQPVAEPREVSPPEAPATAVVLPPGDDPALAEPYPPIDPLPEADPDTAPAGVAQASRAPAGSTTDPKEPIQAERQIEVVTARLPESQETASEAVMLRMPTSNPNIVVYWLMDDDRPMAEDKQGD